jgi:hypothetical protein
MRIETFISKDQQTVGVLILVRNVDTNIYEGILRYTNIWTSETNEKNIDELYLAAQKFCDNEGSTLNIY